MCFPAALAAIPAMMGGGAAAAGSGATLASLGLAGGYGASTMGASAALAAATGGYGAAATGISAATAGTLLTTGLSAVTSLAQGYQQSQVAKQNAKLAAQQADVAAEQGAREEQRHRLDVARQKGEQRAGFAASGLLVDSGSTQSMLEWTAAGGEMDAQIIRSNTARQVQGYRQQAANYRSQAKNARTASYLGAATAVADGWYKLR